MKIEKKYQEVLKHFKPLLEASVSPLKGGVKSHSGDYFLSGEDYQQSLGLPVVYSETSIRQLFEFYIQRAEHKNYGNFYVHPFTDVNVSFPGIEEIVEEPVIKVEDSINLNYTVCTSTTRVFTLQECWMTYGSYNSDSNRGRKVPHDAEIYMYARLSNEVFSMWKHYGLSLSDIYKFLELNDVYRGHLKNFKIMTQEQAKAEVTAIANKGYNFMESLADEYTGRRDEYSDVFQNWKRKFQDWRKDSNLHFGDDFDEADYLMKFEFHNTLKQGYQKSSTFIRYLTDTRFIPQAKIAVELFKAGMPAEQCLFVANYYSLQVFHNCFTTEGVFDEENPPVCEVLPTAYFGFFKGYVRLSSELVESAYLSGSKYLYPYWDECDTLITDYNGHRNPLGLNEIRENFSVRRDKISVTNSLESYERDVRVKIKDILKF